MKIKVISRNPDQYVRETKRDIHKSNKFKKKCEVMLTNSILFYF